MTTTAISVYTIPTTGAQILADTLANATIGFPDARPEIEAGTAIIRVEATTDGYKNSRAHIVAGVRTLAGEFWPANLTGTEADDTRFVPRIAFQSKDGRLSAAESARKMLNRFFAMADNTPIEWVSFGS